MIANRGEYYSHLFIHLIYGTQRSTQNQIKILIRRINLLKCFSATLIYLAQIICVAFFLYALVNIPLRLRTSLLIFSKLFSGMFLEI